MTFSGRFSESTLTAEAQNRLARGQRQAAFMQAVKDPLFQEMTARGPTVT